MWPCSVLELTSPLRAHHLRKEEIGDSTAREVILSREVILNKEVIPSKEAILSREAIPSKVAIPSKGTSSILSSSSLFMCNSSLRIMVWGAVELGKY